MDDKERTEAEAAQAEREKGAAMEYDAQDEEALETNAPTPAPSGGTSE